VECFPDGFGDDPFAGGVGVDAVGLVEGGVAAYAFEEEGDEGDLIVSGEAGINIVEGGGVGGAHAWGDAHAAEEDLTFWISVADGVDNGLEVGMGGFDGDAAEAVVGAEFEDEDVDGLTEDPADASQSAGGGFAADAGVDGLIGQVEGVEAAADAGGEGLIGVEAVAGGQAVAEEKNSFGHWRRDEGSCAQQEDDRPNSVTESQHKGGCYVI
jgi:hypothetical protein